VTPAPPSPSESPTSSASAPACLHPRPPRAHLRRSHRIGCPACLRSMKKKKITGRIGTNRPGPSNQALLSSASTRTDAAGRPNLVRPEGKQPHGKCSRQASASGSPLLQLAELQDVGLEGKSVASNAQANKIQPAHNAAARQQVGNGRPRSSGFNSSSCGSGGSARKGRDLGTPLISPGVWVRAASLGLAKLEVNCLVACRPNATFKPWQLTSDVESHLRAFSFHHGAKQ